MSWTDLFDQVEAAARQRWPEPRSVTVSVTRILMEGRVVCGATVTIQYGVPGEHHAHVVATVRSFHFATIEDALTKVIGDVAADNWSHCPPPAGTSLIDQGVGL